MLDLHGNITKHNLKVATGKFGLDIIFNLDISCQNITNISLLSECHNLILLNISNNLISDLKPL